MYIPDYVKLVKKMEHYLIYVDDRFECSCDRHELKENLQEIRERYDQSH